MGMDSPPLADEDEATSSAMASAPDEFDRLEQLIYRPVSTRPDWLKALVPHNRSQKPAVQSLLNWLKTSAQLPLA